MIYNLIGNIASGKTTLAQMIRQKTGYKIYDIDDYRTRYNKKATQLGERMAWNIFMDDLAEIKDGIITTSGTSQYYELMLARLSSGYMTIKVDTSPSECWKNHQARSKKGYTPVPMPFETKNLQSGIYKLHDILLMADYDITWKKGEFLPI